MTDAGAHREAAILAAAREVFRAGPQAPIAAVAEAAGIGISALYRRWASKEDLLRALCHDGLRSLIAEAERATAEPDDWTAFARFLHGAVEADAYPLTAHLAGAFTATEELRADAARADELVAGLFERARPRMRPGATRTDAAMLLEMCAAVRTPALRHRYLAVLLDGLCAGPALPAVSGPGGPPAPGRSRPARRRRRSTW